MKTESLSSLYSRAAKHLDIDISNFEVQGEKLRTKLSLKYHKCFVVPRDSYNTATPFPMQPIDKITSAFRKQIVFHDLPRRDSKRNYTLTEDSKSFILITQNTQPIIKLSTSKNNGTYLTNI